MTHDQPYGSPLDLSSDESALSSLLPAVQFAATEQILQIEHNLLREAARVADHEARKNKFLLRQEAKSYNTVKKEIDALSLLMTYLREAGVPLSFHLASEPRLWSAITFGLVEGFLLWEREQGYSIKTMNDHLSIIKLYARLAKQQGIIGADQLLSITSISPLRGDEGRRIDQLRTRSRRGAKKPEPTFLERREEWSALLDRPKTPQGWRDLVAILLMYDLSLRPNEVVDLVLADVSLDEGTLSVYRKKTDLHQKLRLTGRLQVALTNYLRLRRDRSPSAPLLVRTRKNGQLIELQLRHSPEEEARRAGGRQSLHDGRLPSILWQKREAMKASLPEGILWTPPLTTRALRERLHEIGNEIEEAVYGGSRSPAEQINLTSYDGRHEWTRNAIRGGSDPIAVTAAGGWKANSAMVRRYYGELQIANEDITLKR